MDKLTGGIVGAAGDLRGRVTRNLGELRVNPAPPFWHAKNWLRYRRRDVPQNVALSLLGQVGGVVTLRSELSGVVYRRPADLAPWQVDQLRELMEKNVAFRELPRFFGGELVNYGLLSRRFVTDAGVAALVDGFQGLFTISNFKFHGYGTGTTAENVNQTALVTELTTQYNPDSTRPTGSQTEGAANVYRSVGTLSPDSGGTIAITEHGLFSASSAGTLWDRSVFSAINLVAGSDSLQTTYDGTFASGG